MCGFFGYLISNGGISPTRRQALAKDAMSKLKHRGPDTNGFEEYKFGGRVLGLGHTRLAIIDLNDHARQPMHSSDQGFVLVYNGEIYNFEELRSELISMGFVFATDSDTEVLLYAWLAWGRDCLARFVGMFAFAILDKNKNKLILARDCFGVKPLFFSVTEGGLYFASEIQALRALVNTRNKPNTKVVYDYLIYANYDDTSNTFFDGIRRFPQGHFLEVDLNNSFAQYQSLKPLRWWWPNITECTPISFTDAAQHLRKLFLRSVKLHLRSDTPICVSLSGGIDSSAIVCAIRRINPTISIHTLSYVTPESSAINEESWIDLINAYVGAISHKVSFSSENLRADMDSMLRTQGEPFGSLSIYAQYKVCEKASKLGFKVILDGQGADELFAGYTGYPISRMRSLLERGDLKTLYTFIKEWGKWPGRSSGLALKLLFNLLLPRRMRIVRDRILGGDSIPPRWLNREVLLREGISLLSEARKFDPEARKRRLSEELRRVLTGKGLSHLLRHADRNAMTFSIENRVPFLSMEIAEFVLSLPESFLISDTGETKSILRAAMRGIVPDEILDRRDKIGFEAPDLRLINDNRLYLENWIEDLDRIRFIIPSEYRKAVLNYINTQEGDSRRAWRLINLAFWHRVSFERESLHHSCSAYS